MPYAASDSRDSRRSAALPALLFACLFACLFVCLFVLGGCGLPSFVVTPVSSEHTLKEEVVQPGGGIGGGKVAIIEVEGLLANVKSGGLLKPTENDLSLFAQQLDKAEKDPQVKAVVLRINSPGGTVTTSDTMYQMLLRFRQKTGKPIVADTQEVCASGAYYIACAADKIVAHPTSLVGSIGVIFNTLEFKDGLDRLGIRADAIHSGPLKEMGSPFKHAEKKETVVMQEMVNEYFARFAGVVSSRRPVTEKTPPTIPMSEDYAGIYSGRVFSGEKAVALGLADRTGLLPDALDLARQLAKAPGAKAVLYHRPYGYGGSIYAQNPTPPPQANVLQLEIPGATSLLSGGFYYLWQP